MLFNSYIFPVFFILCFSIYWSFRRHARAQNLILLAGSYFFYGWWDHRFLCLLILSTLVDYNCGLGARLKLPNLREKLISCGFTVVFSSIILLIDYQSLISGETSIFRQEAQPYWLALTIAALSLFVSSPLPALLGLSKAASRKYYVATSVVINLSILCLFKYFNFFIESFHSLASGLFGTQVGFDTLHIILPVGISFYTFQTMSYTIDVYRGKVAPTHCFWDLGAYVTFFPQLVAGPIERAFHLLPQFQQPRKLDKNQAKQAVWLILWGFYKKIVVADNLAIVVNESFAQAGAGNGGAFYLIAIYAFAFQIYGDFSGYTDIARGVSKLLGFDLTLNFRIPYASLSPSEFWSRWHISLSSWLRDYLYIPLGGNRKGPGKTYRNLMLTMLLGGLWHGAAWTFIIWGFYQGLILILYRIFVPNIDNSPGSKISIFFKWLLMFHLVCLGWLIFRAPDIQTIVLFSQNILTDFRITPEAIANLKTLLFHTGFLILFQIYQHKVQHLMPFRQWPRFLKWNLYLFILYSLFSLSSQGGQDFIYFAF